MTFTSLRNFKSLFSRVAYRNCCKKAPVENTITKMTPVKRHKQRPVIQDMFIIRIHLWKYQTW